MGNDVDPVLDDDDEDEDPFVDVSGAVEAERAKLRRCCPRRHAQEGQGGAPNSIRVSPIPSWSESEIELTEGDDEDDEAPIESAKTILRRVAMQSATGNRSAFDGRRPR